MKSTPTGHRVWSLELPRRKNIDSTYIKKMEDLEDEEQMKGKWVAPDSLTILSHGDTKVYIVGTAHISKESCIDVQRVVRHVKPSVLMLELCDRRSHMLNPIMKLGKSQSIKDLFLMVRSGKINRMTALMSYVYSQIGDKLDCFPGDEFRIGYNEFVKQHYADKSNKKRIVVLGDRRLQVTLKRSWAKLSLWQQSKIAFDMMGGLFLSADKIRKMIEELKDRKSDLFTDLCEQLKVQYPSLYETILIERDHWLTASIKNCVRVAHHTKQNTNENASIVVIVGMGHVDGIKNQWEQDTDAAYLERINTLPVERSKSSKRWIKRLFVVVVVSTTFWGIRKLYRSRSK